MTAHLRCDVCGEAADESAEISYRKGWRAFTSIRYSWVSAALFGLNVPDSYWMDACPSCAGYDDADTHGFTYSVVHLDEESMMVVTDHVGFWGPSPWLLTIRRLWLLLNGLITFWMAHMFFRWLESSL